jgi:hypothetical protein
MFERFTDKARTAVIAARAEAAERGDQIRDVIEIAAWDAEKTSRHSGALDLGFHGVPTGPAQSDLTM